MPNLRCLEYQAHPSEIRIKVPYVDDHGLTSGWYSAPLDAVILNNRQALLELIQTQARSDCLIAVTFEKLGNHRKTACIFTKPEFIEEPPR